MSLFCEFQSDCDAETLEAIGAFCLVIIASVGYFLPRLSAFVFGPGIVISSISYAVKNAQLFSFFRSEGSAAGLFIPILMWFGLVVACGVGVLLIVVGLSQLKASRAGQDQGT